MTQRRARRVGLRRGLVACGAALIALAMMAGASAQNGTSAVQLAGLEAESWPEAQAVLAVLDDAGQPVADLGNENFTVFLNESPAPVTGVENAVDSSLSIAVVLALDVSGSMEGGALEQAKAAAHDFLDGLALDDALAIVTFGTTVDVALASTTDRDAAAAAIDGLEARGTTALYDATAQSAELLGVETGRRALVLLSDGVDNGSAIAQEEAIEAAGSLGAPVFAIGLGDEIDHDFLQALADQSGGRFAETPTPAGLAALYAEAGELLRGQYVVSFDATDLGLAASDALTLRVESIVEGTVIVAERTVCPQRLCVALQSILPGEQLEDARTIVADVVSDEPIESVVFFVDGAEELELSAPPFEFTLAPGALADGDHTIAAEASTASNTTRSSEVVVQIGASGSALPVSPVLIAAAIGIGLVVLAALFILVRRRGGSGGTEPDLEPIRPRQPDGDEPVPKVKQPLWEEREPLPLPATTNKVLGELRVTAGPLAGKVFPVGDAPASIGCGDRCHIRLPEDSAPDDQIISEHARVWVRDGQLMVHEVKRLTERGAIGGSWQILAPGDDFNVWNHTFQFVPEGVEIAAREEAGNGADAGTPDVLRDKPATAPQNGGTAATRPDPSLAPQAADTAAKNVDSRSETDGAPPNVLRDKPATSDVAQDGAISS